ncbi:ankyrin repeat-containing protein [Colletotrichum chrysophilum]|uniref:Ankyrin repeat-containing protein n=1 Tax=Colletotrichum chrysophilum TaxID=1836956 RepID=A0AAD9A179_9PEZI|nr:ankyrin repeat-containing protein [Colletotrichum chrysophilum]
MNTAQSLISARSFGSDDTAVNSLAGSWSSGRSTATIASTAQEDLENAIMSGDVVQVEALCLMGVALSEDRFFLLYEACLRGPRIVNALALHPAHDFAGRIGGPTSDYVFHMVLRTPAIDFMNLWADGAGAALSIKEAVIRLLLEKDIDFTLRDRLGDTILHTVCGDIGTLNLQKETERFTFLERFLGESDGGYSETVVQTCRSMINLQNSGRIKEDGTRQNFWHTPLGVAILYNNLKCARLLLEHGADPHITGEWGEPPIYFAVRNDSTAAVRLLLAYGARPTTSTHSLPCSAAIFEIIDDDRRGHHTFRE